MQKLLCFLIVGILIFGCVSKDKIQRFEDSNKIVIGAIDSIHSEVLGESRKFWVHLPKNYDAAADADKKYPVVYLLDGDAHFYSVVGMIEQLSTTNGNTICPEMVVVAIPNTDRTRDLTPTHVDVAFGDSTFVKTSGGGDQFLDFLEKELIPYIDNNYPVAPYRTYIGHSFGGLTVLHTLLERPQLFTNYVAIDPSLWWDDGVLLEKADDVFQEERFSGKSLFVGVANTMPASMEYSKVELDTTEETDHIRSILKFAKATEIKNGGMNFGWKYYQEDDHGSVPLITEYDALHFLFPWYTLPNLADKLFPEPTVSPEELLTIIKLHYTNVSEHFGYAVLPNEQMINGMGYQLLQMKKPEYAFAFFDLNIKNYPNHANVFDSMGDYYLAQADTINAIKFFEKAISMGDLAYSKDKLEQLKSSD